MRLCPDVSSRTNDGAALCHPWRSHGLVYGRVSSEDEGCVSSLDLSLSAFAASKVSNRAKAKSRRSSTVKCSDNEGGYGRGFVSEAGRGLVTSTSSFTVSVSVTTRTSGSLAQLLTSNWTEKINAKRLKLRAVKVGIHLIFSFTP